MYYLRLALLILLVVPNTTGCAAIIAGAALGRHADRKDRELELRHREKMRELDIQERWMKAQQPQVQQAPTYPTYTTDAGIVRDNPF